MYPFNDCRRRRKNEMVIMTEAKNECLKRIGVEVLSYAEIKPYLKYVERVYGKDYLKKFRNNVPKTE